MLSLLIDVNFDHRILRGLRLRLPALDYLIAQRIGLSEMDDADLLAWAAEEERVVLTHDVNTLPGFARVRVAEALPMAGLIIVPEQLAIGVAVDELEILLLCSELADLQDQIQFIPL